MLQETGNNSMSAEIIQFIPRANPTRMSAQELEAMGLALINAALLACEPTPPASVTQSPQPGERP